MTVKLTGYLARPDRFRKDVGRALDDAAMAMLADVVVQADRTVPVSSGRLKGSRTRRKIVDLGTAAVAWLMPYAKPLHKRRPFIFRAYDRVQRTALRAAGKAMQKGLYRLRPPS